MKPFLRVTAVVEGSTGLALLAAPSIPVSLLFGTTLGTLVAITITRIAGVTLLTLGIACWMASRDAGSRAAVGVVTAMLVYNVMVGGLFARAGLGPPPQGIALWPAALAHVVLAIWCLTCLRSARAGGTKS